MVRPKASVKKQQKRGIDFKKIKRKIGRKLPPPKNATNTEIKSKAIILPEQSVASEKAGLAVSKKGLTLKELLHQTSHHNAKVRKDALIGIRDIFVKYPAELKLHKLAVIEKLRERISDDDKLVRETLYQLLKAVIFPSSKEDNQGPFISLMMAYIFNAMTHLGIDIRLMAFKFFDLVVQYYPTSFSLYAEKILQNYEDILRKNQFFLQEKGKLKSTLAGLTRCLSLLPCNKREDDSSTENDVATERVLHAFEVDAPKDSARLSVVRKKLKDLLPVLVSCFQEFIPLVNTTTQLDSQSFDCMLSILRSIDLVVEFFVRGINKSQNELQVSPLPSARPDFTLWNQTFSPALLKKLFNVFPVNPMRHLSEKIGNGMQSSKAFHEKHSLPLIPFIPKLITQVESNWKPRLLQAFTKVFKSCKPESLLKLACLSAIEEMLVPKQGCAYLDSSDPEILDYQITWIRELPLLLIHLGDKHPLSSKAVVRLQLQLGQCALLNASFSREYDNMQLSLREFYGTFIEDSSVCYGPFIRLPRDIQELSVCCLYYFSFLDSVLLQALASCCLRHDLDPYLSSRILEVLLSAYKAGHIRIADYISFLVTLLVRCKVFPEKSYPIIANDGKSNSRTFKSITSSVCSSLLQIGDDSLVFKMLEKIVIDQISLKLSLDNMCALLRMLITVDSTPTRLSEQSVIKLSNGLAGYLIGVVSCIREADDESTTFIRKSRRRYYLLPCLFLFYSSTKLLILALHSLGSFVTENTKSLDALQSMNYATDVSSRVSAAVSVLVLIDTDEKLQRNLLLCKAEIDRILHNILQIQASEESILTIEEKHKIQCAFDRLKKVVEK